MFLELHMTGENVHYKATTLLVIQAVLEIVSNNVTVNFMTKM